MTKRVLIFGVGKFGSAMALKFLKFDSIDLELIDIEITQLNQFKKYNIPLHSLNSLEIDNIKSLDIQEKDYCLLMYGDDLTASILTCQNLLDLGNKNIYVRIINNVHKKIIESLGVTQFIDVNNIVSEQVVSEITHNFSFLFTQKEINVFKITNQKINQKSMGLIAFKDKYSANIILIKRKVIENDNRVSFIIPDDNTEILLNDELFLLLLKDADKDKIRKLFHNN